MTQLVGEHLMRGSVYDEGDGVADVETPCKGCVTMRYARVPRPPSSKYSSALSLKRTVASGFDPYRLWPGDVSGDHVQTLGQCEPVVGLVGLYDNVVGIDALADTVVAGPDVRHVDPLKGRGEAVDVLPALGYAHVQFVAPGRPD